MGDFSKHLFGIATTYGAPMEPDGIAL